MIKRKGTIWIIAGLLLLMAALSLTGYNVWTEHTAGIQADEVVNRLAEIIPEAVGALEYPSRAPTFSDETCGVV